MFRSLTERGRLRLSLSRRPSTIALTRLVTGSHVLAVEAAKWVPRPQGQRDPLPRDWRLCRLCGEGVEDELHLRSAMLNDVWQVFPGLKGRAQTPLQWWKLVMEYEEVVPRVAEYVFDVMAVVRDVPMYIPEWYV
ncbi:hypothetical protein BDZ89DRAFT_1061481 [Hymenopellis radicata]|nr:hypothetical protein BDZ89DRAFT_1061481 [Hymenopellis radicata]